MDIKNFVTYEQALALKKLGFREKCLYYYFNGALYPNDVYAHRIDKNSFHRRYNVESLGKIRNIAKEPLLCDAPTLSQAQEWLRKQGYNIGLRIYNYNWELTVCFKFCERPMYNNLYASYEDALSVGITKCLKFLNE